MAVRRTGRSPVVGFVALVLFLIVIVFGMILVKSAF